jgi:UDP-glucuronate decarboxylase
MKILVTGGTGFIGNHLCRRLLQEGHYIICLDNNFTGSMNNIKDLLQNSNFEFIRHDITLPIFLEVEQIYHLACPASPKAYQYNSIKTIKTNILGTINSLGIAKRTKARILLTSTSEVYGDPHISPQVEEYWGNVNPIGIRSCYDEGKRVAETLMIEYHRNHNVDIRIARIFNTYGPNMDKEDGRVVSNFINQCLENKDITIYGNGSQTRSFCYVDDTVDGLIKLMNQTETIGPINIGNPYELKIKDLAEILLRKIETKSKSNIIYKDLPSDDPMKRQPCIEKAKKYLNWTPKIELDEGLEKTIIYFRSILF